MRPIISAARKPIRRPSPGIKNHPVSKLSGMTPAFAFLIGSRNRVGEKIYTERDDATLSAITARYFSPGYSIINQKGFWTDPDGTFCEEASRMVIIASADIQKMESWRNQIVMALQQKTVVQLGYWTALYYDTDMERLKVMPGARRKRLPRSKIKKT